MAQTPPPFLSTDFNHPHHRKAVATLIATVLVLGIGVWMYLLNSEGTTVGISPDTSKDQARQEKLAEISESLTVQEQTPQFKAKLEEISQSLNKK